MDRSTPSLGKPEASALEDIRPSRALGMLGLLIPILAMTPFDFTFVDSSKSASVVIHPGLNVIDYKKARLVVRIHETSMVATQSLTLFAYGTNPCFHDPREFTLASSSLFVEVTSSAAAGSLITATDTHLFPYLKMVVTGNQGSATGGQSLFAVLSADLLLKE